MTPAKHILWVDDEVDLLQAHQIFLERKGYRVSTTYSGSDALALVSENHYDLVLLDEMMPGMGGLETLEGIKRLQPHLPIIMVTKNEAEELMDQAIGQQISSYLLKPVQPLQVLSVCKQILDQTDLRERQIPPHYVSEFNALSDRILADPEYSEWIDIYLDLVKWDMELESIAHNSLRSTHVDLFQEANLHFANFIRKNYPHWMKRNAPRPVMSPEIIARYVLPNRPDHNHVLFIIIDCLRMDQWMVIESMIQSQFTIERNYYYSILPTATPYARNAIFAGLYPDEIAAQYKTHWLEDADDDSSRNNSEAYFFQQHISRLQPELSDQIRYFKANTSEEMSVFHKKIDNYLAQPLTALVVNFVDILTHGRSESNLVKELSRDTAAFRSLMSSWFQHSVLYEIIQAVKQKNMRIVITSDHGAVLCRRATKVIGDKDTSRNIRYKFGANLQCDEKIVLRIRHPEDFRLPADAFNKNYLVAAEDYYLIYPTNFNHYQRFYADSFQHGGISLEEMILPIVTLTPR